MTRNGVFFGVATLTALACGGIDEPNFFSSTATTPAAHDSGASSKGDSGGSEFTDAGVTPFDAGTIEVDSSLPPPPADPGIFCGTGNYCDPNSQFCCATGQELGTADFACGTNKNDCTDDALGGVVIPCDKTAECGGQFCCGQFEQGSPSEYTQVRCQASCAGTNARIFCDPANGDADCAGTGTCGMSGTLPGFYVCSK